ncbi:hypothetical protein [Thermus sp.]|uniref:hypothetical protein n=1 Tax=Thermus sp. TaxID=275 RepID=UPI0025DA5253|nr:hypothetical protein [Thermus sp.]MCS6868078.1 hypothetical protein [Thermus sp.]
MAILGRKPNYLAYEALLHPSLMGHLRKTLGPKGRAALILLFLALEANRALAGETKPRRREPPDLARVARALDSGRGAWGKALLQALEDHLPSLLPLAPEEVRARPKGQQARALRRHLVRTATGYRPRDLWREVLEGVGKLLPNPSPEANALLECRCLPGAPEVVLALVPVPGLGEAFFQVMAARNALRREELEAATANLFVFGFLRDGRLPRFQGWPSRVFRQLDPLKVAIGNQPPWAYLHVRVRGNLLEAEGGGNGEVHLRAYLDYNQDLPLPSPHLGQVLADWYPFASAVVASYLGCGGPLHGNGDQGYDWDLVQEYHEAILRGLREGRCPFDGTLRAKAGGKV